MKTRKKAFLNEMTPMNAAKRVRFDVDRAELERKREERQAKFEQIQLAAKARRAELEEQYGYDRALIEAKSKEIQRKAEKAAKKALRVAKYDAKWVYVRGGHFKNELLGFLTVFNFNRAQGIKITRHVSYDEKNKALYLDIYQRKNRDTSQKLPVFVYIHGGGWIGGLPETREGFTTRIAEYGYFTVSLYYGHAPFYAHPRPIENIYKAFAWLKAHAEEYNIDTDSIFVGGESAGGHLSAMVGAVASNPEYSAHFLLDESSRKQKIAGLVLNCGVYDMEKAVTTGFKNINFYTQSYCGGIEVKDLSEDMRKEISPINWVNGDFPPTFAISAENDKLAVLTYDMVAKLDDLGVEVSHYHGKGKYAVHAFAVAQVLKITKEAMKGIKAFLKRRTEELGL